MSVYVDPKFKWIDGNHYSHMTADTLEELHSFAKSLGLRRKWLHISASGIPHYDLNRSKRWTAIQRGAVELSAPDWLKIAKRHQIDMLTHETNIIEDAIDMAMNSDET